MRARSRASRRWRARPTRSTRACWPNLPSRAGAGALDPIARGARHARAAKRRLQLVRLRTSAKNRVFGCSPSGACGSQPERLRRGDAMELLADRGVPEVGRRSIAEALAVIDLLDE